MVVALLRSVSLDLGGNGETRKSLSPCPLSRSDHLVLVDLRTEGGFVAGPPKSAVAGAGDDVIKIKCCLKPWAPSNARGKPARGQPTGVSKRNRKARLCGTVETPPNSSIIIWISWGVAHSSLREG